MPPWALRGQHGVGEGAALRLPLSGIDRDGLVDAMRRYDIYTWDKRQVPWKATEYPVIPNASWKEVLAVIGAEVRLGWPASDFYVEHHP